MDLSPLIVWGNTIANWAALVLLLVLVVRSIKDRQLRKGSEMARRMLLLEVRKLREEIKTIRSSDELSSVSSGDENASHEQL